MHARPAWQPWRRAWQQSLYADDGFYRRHGRGPAGHFATAVQGAPLVGQMMARAVVELCAANGLTRVVDIGCGRGELLAEVRAIEPSLRCTGVEVVDRPGGLDRRIGWLPSPGGPDLPDGLADLAGVLVLANEWLDVVPCTVAQVDGDGTLREVEVNTDGAERLGGPVAPQDRAWAEQHWPAALRDRGDRVEVGRARDLAYADLVARVRDGVVVAADYGHTARSRPAGGSLTGYRDGRQVPPSPDRSCDLTAHVAMDTLGADEVVSQREALGRLPGVAAAGRLPQHHRARADPAGYLAGLSLASAVAALRAGDGFGGFLWAISRVGAFTSTEERRATPSPGLTRVSPDK